MIRDLNKAGLTAFGSSGCEEDMLGDVPQVGGRKAG